MKTSRTRRRFEPFLVLLTIAWIVGLFAAAAGPLQDLWRPLVVSLAIAAVLTMAAGLIPASGQWPLLAVGAAWLLALGAWPLALAIGLVVGWRLAVDMMRRARRRRAVVEPPDGHAARVLNALGGAGVVVASLSLATSGAIRLAADAPDLPSLPHTGDAPNFYLVLLDGYPSSSTLEAEFGFDNSGFEDALAERGFHVTADSYSNYNRTLLTLSSMLHLRHVDEIPGLSQPRDGFAAQNRQLTAAINDAPVPAMLREAGYRAVAIASSYGEATLTSADDTISGRSLTLFEEQLLRYTSLGRWVIGIDPEIVANQHRTGVLDGLRALQAVADGPAADSQFVLAHIFSPHAPFVFRADGSPRPVQSCYPHSCGLTTPEANRLGMSVDEYGEALIGQVEFLNSAVLEAVDAIAADDPSGVIVLFSDHGVRFEEGPADEHFRTFLAARTPGHEALLGDEVTLVNVMPRMLNAYFGAGLSLSDDRFAWAPDEAPLELRPVAPVNER